MKNNGTYKFQIGDRDISIELQYGFRKRLTLTVYPDQRIVARIPYGLSKRKVDDYLQKKTKWMVKHLEHFENHPPEREKKFINGEKHVYLGNNYDLKLVTGSTLVEIINDTLVLRIRDLHDKKHADTVLNHWYRKEAIRVMTPRFNKIFENLQHLDLPKVSLRFFKMKRRWGSCSTKHVITLNTELIKKEIELIDYVIVHEICHLKVPAHNKAFYSLLASVMPDWKERRATLNKFSSL
jgi:predicted metal-dependent hydrolase